MSNFLDSFGKKIRRVRKEKGLTQEELAEKCGLQNTYIGGIERGERNISLQSVERLAEGLELLPTDLFKFSDINLNEVSNNKNALIEAQIELLMNKSEDELVFLQRMTKEILSLLEMYKKENI